MTTILILRDTQGGFCIKLQSDDPSAFKLCIETLKSFVPVPQRSYDPTTKQWTVVVSAADRVHRWLAYCRANLHAQVEWLNSGGDYEPEAGWTSPPPRRRPTKDDAYRTLYLQPNSPPDLVRVVFRYLATVHHPDKPGGDQEKMKAINAAYKQLAA